MDQTAARRAYAEWILRGRVAAPPRLRRESSVETSRGPSVDAARYLFGRDSAGAWTQYAKLVAADAAARDNFGRAVAVWGDVVVVGAWLDADAGSGSGSAYIFDT